MKIQKIAAIFVLAFITLTSCKTEVKKEVVKQEILAENLQKVTLNVSGMTCEIGCAKTIQSKLSKKEGIASAKVVFTDSLAYVEYDASKLSKSDIITFVDGIAGGDLYKATETKGKEHTCTEECKKECEAKKGTDKKACAEDCKMACCADKKG